MITFFKTPQHTVLAVQSSAPFSHEESSKLLWLFGEATPLTDVRLSGWFVGPRREMITPWSTNAVEITQNMGIEGIARIEEYIEVDGRDALFDPMLQRVYEGLDQEIFTISKQPAPILSIDDIAAYNDSEGLALNDDEIAYLNEVSIKLGRKLTDSEVFGFSQVNSEHCRHKIFNGTFVIDGEEKELSLFKLIKKTSADNPNQLVSAYKDNVAFNEGPVVEQFAPQSGDTSDYYEVKEFKSVISLKAETHNFPTTVEPFNGASTGTGGEIRDRLGGGKASLPIAGTAVYMTPYPRPEGGRAWENSMEPRRWLYQTPEQILIKASNGASSFGNHYGQPLICGSLLTFEHEENGKKMAYDKVIMLAGGVGYGKMKDALKGTPETGDKVVLLGGDNYRIGMGGGAVSSVDTGHYANAVELNAVQRANPEMQRRAANVIRALAESDDNPIVSIHDHGAGGHLNCLSELIEQTGGKIHMDQLPIGDSTLSAKEIVGNESQERMGLLIKEKDIERVRRIAERERSPMYVVGEATGDGMFTFEQTDGQCPINLPLEYMFGKPPRTYMHDSTVNETFEPVVYREGEIQEYIENVLQLEAVACKDWLTNKVDRSVTGKVARQQCQGEVQLPLSDCGVVALDYRGKAGIATSIGHAPQAAIVDPQAGSVLAIAESLTNIVFAPLTHGLGGVSLSANWMWPCRNVGEDARLYKAVEAASDFASALGINIPTGKDSLSMTQKYGQEKVLSPGTVIISAGAEVSDVRKVVGPVVEKNRQTYIYHIDFSFDSFKLGGSAFAQSLGRLGDEVPTVTNPEYFADTFEAVQTLINKGLVLAGHDISAGGLITALLEMCFGNVNGGLSVNLDSAQENDLIKVLFSENPGILIQVADRKATEEILDEYGVGYARIAHPCAEREVLVSKAGQLVRFDIERLRDLWFSTSYQLDRLQSGEECAKARFENYKQQPIQLIYPNGFKGTLQSYGLTADRTEKSGIKAAVIREKGNQCERETAYALYLAGFDVKDVHVTDLTSGRETLDDVNMVIYVGGFSNSDVLGSAKGWAGSLLYNPKAKETLDRFYARPDTLSMGFCNGCQLMVELGLIYPDHDQQPKMLHNRSHKFESQFLGLTIPENNSVMLSSLAGTKIGVWVAHGEGRFSLPYEESKYHIVAKYNYAGYPANPNGSDYNVAGICSADGRHLAMMPHPERALFPWQWGYCPTEHRTDEVSPWMEAFVNARKWIEKTIKN